MQITINEEEIKAGCKRYLADQNIGIEGQDITVTLAAGRSPNRFSATIEIVTISPDVVVPEDTEDTAPVTEGAVDPEVTEADQEAVETDGDDGMFDTVSDDTAADSEAEPAGDDGEDLFGA